MKGIFNTEKKSFQFLLEKTVPAFRQEKNMQALADGIGIVTEITDLQKKEGGDFFLLEQGDFWGVGSTVNKKAIPHLALTREKDFYEGWPLKTLFNYTSSRTIKNVKITTAASNINEIIQNREEMKQQFYCKKQQKFIKANKLLEKYYKLEKNVINEYNDNAFNHKKYQTVNPRSYVVESLNDSSFFRPIGKAFKKPDILRIAGIDGCNISDINELGVVTEWSTLYTNVDVFLRKNRWDTLINTQEKKGIIVDALEQRSWLNEQGFFKSSSFFQSKELFDMIIETNPEMLKMAWPVLDSFFKWHKTMWKEGIEELIIQTGEDWIDYIWRN